MGERMTTWLAREFEEVELGDQRLNKRCQKITQIMGQHPNQSIPKACEDWANTKAAYRFLSHGEVTREELLKSHLQHTSERSHQCQDILSIQDTTYLNFTHHPATQGLGPIGTRDQSIQGLVVHNTMAVSLDKGEVLGLLHQEVWVRPDQPRPKKETARERQQRDRENLCWGRSIEALRQTGSPNLIHVMDREGDIYEVLAKLEDTHERYVIRARHNRRLKDQGKNHLFEVLRGRASLGKMAVPVKAKPGQKARIAFLSLRRLTVTIPAPEHVKPQGRKIEVSVVEAFEGHAPKGCAPLHWILLTKEPTATFENCVRVVTIYTRRWKIEEFHMAIKTGCSMEKRQLETRERLESLLGLISVIAIGLLRLRDAARRQEDRASPYLSDVQIILLGSKVRGLSANPTAREALRAIAKLGGFLGRKSDGEPGWRTIWGGMEKLLLIEQGYDLVKNSPKLLRRLQRCG